MDLDLEKPAWRRGRGRRVFEDPEAAVSVSGNANGGSQGGGHAVRRRWP